MLRVQKLRNTISYVIPSRTMKNLSYISLDEQKKFLNSFDQVLCDVDGVLYTHEKKISGASETIKLLKKLGKKIIFVSNNTLKTHRDYYEKLKSEISETEFDLFTPTSAMISYLKKQNFSKEIYLIGMSSLRRDLQQSGFTITEEISEVGSLDDFIKGCLNCNRNVGAVILDIDLNTNVLKLQKAVNYLNKPDVIFITGSIFNRVNLAPNSVVFGPGYLHYILEDLTGRKGICLAKPSLDFNKFLKEKHDIGSPSRVLVIGDSIDEDMAFASNCGYQKLLVLSGWTGQEVLTNWSFSQRFKPNYYVNTLETLKDLLLKLK